MATPTRAAHMGNNAIQLAIQLTGSKEWKSLPKKEKDKRVAEALAAEKKGPAATKALQKKYGK